MAATDPAARPRPLTPAQLRSALAGDPGPVLVDVLPEACYLASRIPGAGNACVYEMVFGDKIRSLAPDKTRSVVVYGHGGHARDAEVAAEKLQRLGYRDVGYLAGGRLAWHAAGLPLEGEDPVPAAPEGTTVLAPGTYTADAAASKIHWEGRNPNGAHDGTVGLGSGQVVVAGDGAITGRFIVDLRTIANADLEGEVSQPALHAHLASDDFFFVERFPTATFVVDSATRIPDAAPTTPNYEVAGTLELRGIKAPLCFAATLNRLGDGSHAVEAHFDLDRTKWGVIYGSARFFAHLGMHVVFDPISFSLRIVLA